MKINNIIANSVDPDETARHEPSHLDLHCLQRNMCWFAWVKGLRYQTSTKLIMKAEIRLVIRVPIVRIYSKNSIDGQKETQSQSIAYK